MTTHHAPRDPDHRPTPTSRSSASSASSTPRRRRSSGPTPTPSWSPSGSARANLTMTIDHFDCRTGGSYRYVHSRDGEEYGFHGCFHEVRPNELIVQTFTFEGMPDGVALEKLRARGPRRRPHPPRRRRRWSTVRGPRRLRRQRHGDRRRRGLRAPRRAPRPQLTPHETCALALIGTPMGASVQISSEGTSVAMRTICSPRLVDRGAWHPPAPSTSRSSPCRWPR